MTSNKPAVGHFQLALALAIAKSKPPGITIQDYVLKLRHHILSGSRTEHYGSSHQYLDAASYWHSMFKNAQMEIDELHTCNLKLERKSEKLRAEGTPPVHTVIGVKPAPKRKQEVAKSSGSLKHKKLNTGKQTTTRADDLVLEELSTFDVPGNGSTTVLHLYRAHKLYEQIEPDFSALAYHLTQAASNLAEHVSTIANQLQQQLLDASLTLDKRQKTQLTAIVTTRIDAEFPRVLRAAGRSFVSLFHGLSSLWEQGTESARRHHGSTTYTYICAYETLLSAIASTCELNAKQNEAIAPTEAANSDQKTPLRVKRANKALIPQELMTLLLALLTHLAPSKHCGHTPLYEGMLYLLLDRVGKRLFFLTFHHERSNTCEGDIDSFDTSEPEDIQRKAASIEVKFLVTLLERAMNLAPSFLGLASGELANGLMPSRAITTKKASSTAKSNQPKPSLSVAAKERLQRTLVHCMFGDESQPRETSDTEDEVSNNEFIEVLRKPIQMGPLPQPPKIHDVDIPQWFREEIWRLVGWDILCRDSEW